MNKADIAIVDHRLDLKAAVDRTHRKEILRRRHDTADRMHRELLHDAINRWQAAEAGSSRWPCRSRGRDPRRELFRKPWLDTIQSDPIF